MATLQSQLQNLARSFAEQVVEAIRGTSLHELIGAKDGGSEVGNGRRARVVAGGGGMPDPLSASPKKASKNGRLPRRSANDIQAALGQIVGLLKKHSEGLRAEQIRKELGMMPKEMPRVLKEGLSKKALRSKGQKRATTYYAK
jgi:hypothetical protein